MSWREFSPGPDLAEQCLVHGQLKQGAMEFCWDAAMSINVLYGACKLSLFNDHCADSTLRKKNHTNVPLHHSYVLSFQCPPRSGSAFIWCFSLLALEFVPTKHRVFCLFPHLVLSSAFVPSSKPKVNHTEIVTS